MLGHLGDRTGRGSKRTVTTSENWPVKLDRIDKRFRREGVQVCSYIELCLDKPHRSWVLKKTFCLLIRRNDFVKRFKCCIQAKSGYFENLRKINLFSLLLLVES